MTATRKANCSKWFLASAILVLAGCRSFALPKPPVKDVAVEREQRKAVAVEQFEQRRQKAELTAAKAASQRGDWASCQSILEGVLRRVPQNRDARLLLARTHLEQGRQPAAMAQIETAVGDFPEDPKVHETVAGLLEEMGRDEEAWAHMDRARHLAARAGTVLESDKSLPQREGPVATADYLEGVNQPPGGNRIPDSLSDDAAGIEQAGCSDDSDHVRLLVLLDRFEEALKDGEIAQAWDLAREAAGINPNDPSIPTSLAVAALGQGCPDVAVNVARDASVRFPASGSLLRTLGVAYYRQGDLQSSQLVLQQALSLDKHDALAYFLLGCTHTKLGQSQQAQECYSQAERLDARLKVQK